MLIKKIENGLTTASYPFKRSTPVKPGMIVQNYVIDDSVVLGISDGSCPFGIVNSYSETPFLSAIDNVDIYYQSDIFLTDIYDESHRYPINATLFCSKDGIVTTKQEHSNQKSIGMVIKPPVNGNFLEFLFVL
jgi:hypothetical protein